MNFGNSAVWNESFLTEAALAEALNTIDREGIASSGEQLKLSLVSLRNGGTGRQ
jgi:hypothetical protein